MAVDPNASNDTKKFLRQYANNLATAPGGTGSTFGEGVINALSPAAVQNANLGLTPPSNTPRAGSNFTGVTGAADTAPTLRALAPGVSRYALPTGEEAQVYATRGKDGSSVFTDNADYAASVSSGRGLGRAGSPLATVPAGTDPNSEYGTSTLASQGLRQKAFSALTPDQTQDALERAVSSRATDPESALANTNDANLLRARLRSGGGAAAGNGPVYGSNGGIIAGGAPGAGPGGGLIPAGAGNSVTNLKPSDQIALLRAQGALAQGQERVNNTRQALVLQQDGLRRQQGADDRAATSATLDNYAKLQQTDPGSATRYLVNQIPQDADSFAKFKDTPNGRQVLDTYFNDVVRPGAQNTQRGLVNLTGLNHSDNKFADTGPFDWSYLATDKGGRFAGFRTQGEDQDSIEYPANGSITGSQNYDQSLYNFSPAVLKQLREDAINRRK